MDCYQHEHHVAWNRYAGELWRRTKQAIDRNLARKAKLRGIARIPIGVNPATGNPVTIAPVRVSCGKAAEFQVRGVVHFHVLLRLDGVHPIDPNAVIPPPESFGHEDLTEAIRDAANQIQLTTPAHPDQLEGWAIAWGTQLDTRPITMSGHGEVTDSMVAGYLAKYATKSTEVTGHSSMRLTEDTVYDYANFGGNHLERLVAACWKLGRRLTKRTIDFSRPAIGVGDGASPPATTLRNKPTSPDEPNYFRGLQRWAHMLGFGGHFLTKSRRYSITFRFLRDTRITFRRNEISPSDPNTEPTDVDRDGEQTTLVVSTLAFAGVGWHTSADAMLANTSAALARARRETAREEYAHRFATQKTSDEERSIHLGR